MFGEASVALILVFPHHHSYHTHLLPSLSLSFAVILPAAGSGSRVGGETPKQYLPLLGKPVLWHSIRAFSRLEGCVEVVVAVNPAWQAVAEECGAGIANLTYVAGGDQRQDSIANALQGLRTVPDLILVHDAARPCVSPGLIQRVAAAAAAHGAAIPVLPIPETVKRVDSRGAIVATIPRGELRTAQTPQGFRRQLLLSAYSHAKQQGIVGTDDSLLVEMLGHQVQTVDGELTNLKITYAQDVKKAEGILAEGAFG
ncbi:MAG: 2-C-methyl-D-erythritol 4-phosphate cytidylyltransferase [Chlorobi bacterium CHB2]|nr:2-C-methyl-D-erythritol 4-phosphate cytidylyltransferase [Chlorobi bacterium CHB2]